jgi:glutathione S-transferase
MAPAISTATPTAASARFGQVPVIDDDGFVVAESAAIALHLAEKSGRLIPGDAQGRSRVVQWCFAATSTVEPTLVALDFIDIFDTGHAARAVRAEVRKVAVRWLEGVEQRLDGRDWIACADFTVADLMMACVLRSIRKTDLMDPFPRMKGLLLALLRAPCLAAHPRALRRAARRERRADPLAGCGGRSPRRAGAATRAARSRRPSARPASAPRPSAARGSR